MKKLNPISLIATVLMLSACGSQSTRDSFNGSNAGATTSGSSNSVQTSDNSNNYPAATEQRVELGGQNGSDPTKNLYFKTSSTLRVKITPLSAPNLTVPGYTNWVFPYGCLQVTVAVNGITKITKVLRVNGMANSSQCADAPTSEVLDFTGQTSGNGDITVTLQNANYDNCRYYWQNYYGCYMSQVWENHRVAMNVQVQTDGTYMAN